jgi:phosphopantothenoylcysteine decarboxylase/phosphopantothenate--cysteine ligase
MLHGKNVLIGVTGSIAAYKSTYLVRGFVKAGAQVQVVMTPAAAEFITPLTLSTLSKNPVHSAFVDDKESGTWNNHVELGLWADIMVIAPATANTMAKMASSTCDNLLMAVYLSAKCPVYFAPAMDLDMYQHPANKENIAKLQAFGNEMIKPGLGELASGLVGEGRMAEPEEITAFITADLKKGQPLSGKKVLITAGPTYENIDPVRFIGNHSSGKMGYAVAIEAANRGADVVLVSGPTNLDMDHASVQRIRITSAQEMYDACHAHFEGTDIAILSAAVADYRPASVSNSKLKKTENSLTIALEPTKDILKSLGAAKRADQILVGFALETNDEEENAKGKLVRKNLDFIVLNSLNDKGAGFKHDTNKVTMIDRNNIIERFELKSKAEVAVDIIDKTISLLT